MTTRTPKRSSLFTFQQCQHCRHVMKETSNCFSSLWTFTRMGITVRLGYLDSQ